MSFGSGIQSRKFKRGLPDKMTTIDDVVAINVAESFAGRTLKNAEGVSPSFKGIYELCTIPAVFTEGTQNVKGIQGVVTGTVGSTVAEIWGMYGIVNNSGSSAAGYGHVGEFNNIAGGGPSTLCAGVLGNIDIRTNVTSTFSAAVVGQIWDRATTGLQAAFLALMNGDTNRNSVTYNVGAAFKATNRIASFTAGWNYGLDLSQSATNKYFRYADIRLQNSIEVSSGVAATRQAVFNQVGTQGSIGSLYCSSGAKLYVKVANAGANTDWQVVTTTAAD